MTQSSRTRRGADNPIATARDLFRRDIVPVPVLPTEKNPIIEGWQRLPIDESNLEEYFTGDFNVGGLMGSRSKNLNDVDLDSKEALKLWKYFLPATSSRYGRFSKPESHHLYRVNAIDISKGSIPFTDENKKMLVELRIGGGGKAAQSIMPGSYHPSGEAVR
jgi:hypothetical protein